MNEKIVVIPFSYPHYPKEIIEDQINQSKKLLSILSPIFLDTVYGRDEIEKVIRALRTENPCLVVAMIVSWIEAPHLMDTLREYFGNPLVIWSHTTIQLEGKRQTVGAFVAAGVLKQTLNDFDVPFEFIYGKPNDEKVFDQIQTFYRVSRAINKLKKARIGLIGYPALGMYTGTMDHITMRKKFGPEIVHLDQYQILQKMESIEEHRVQEYKSQLKDIAQLEEGIGDEELEISSKMYGALIDIVKENDLDAVTVKCQYELSQIYKFTPCVPLSILGNNLPSSCEGDLQTMLTQLILYYLTGDIVTYCDMHEVLEDRLLVGACGFSPFSMSEKKDCKVCKWGWEAFSGILNSSTLKKGKVTLARLSRDKGDFKIHVGTGNSVEKTDFNEVGCPPYPGTDVILDGSTSEFAKELVSNHYAMVYGNVAKELEILSRWLGFRYIYT